MDNPDEQKQKEGGNVLKNPYVVAMLGALLGGSAGYGGSQFVDDDGAARAELVLIIGEQVKTHLKPVTESLQDLDTSMREMNSRQLVSDLQFQSMTSRVENVQDDLGKIEVDIGVLRGQALRIEDIIDDLDTLKASVLHIEETRFTPADDKQSSNRTLRALGDLNPGMVIPFVD